MNKIYILIISLLSIASCTTANDFKVPYDDINVEEVINKKIEVYEPTEEKIEIKFVEEEPKKETVKEETNITIEPSVEEDKNLLEVKPEVEELKLTETEKEVLRRIKEKYKINEGLSLMEKLTLDVTNNIRQKDKEVVPMQVIQKTYELIKNSNNSSYTLLVYRVYNNWSYNEAR